MLADDDDQQWLVGGGEKRARGGERKQDVEVDAAEVGAQAPGLGQAPGVGDVGVEDGPHEVDADPDPPGARAAVPARGRVPALVEGQREDHQRYQDQAKRGALEQSF